MALTWANFRDKIEITVIALCVVGFFGSWTTSARIETKVEGLDRRLGRVEIKVDRHIEAHANGKTGR